MFWTSTVYAFSSIHLSFLKQLPDFILGNFSSPTLSPFITGMGMPRSTGTFHPPGHGHWFRAGLKSAQYSSMLGFFSETIVKEAVFFSWGCLALENKPGTAKDHHMEPDIWGEKPFQRKEKNKR